MDKVSTIGIDLAKLYFYICGMNKAGKVVMRKKLYRSEMKEYFSKMHQVLIGMESCSSSHYWARELSKLGHEVKLMPPQYVKPYVKRNKNDANDAEACAEAVTRPEMRTVAIKNEKQQELGLVHTIRERLVRARTALVNETRGVLGEFGVIVAQGRNNFATKVYEAIDKSKDTIPPLASELVENLLLELSELENRIKYYDEKIAQIHKTHPVCQRLTKIPGVGPVVATAIVAMAPDANCFKNARQFSAYLGLTPRENSSGGKVKLGSISKKGNSYIRKQLVQGSQAVINWVNKKEDPSSLWLKNLCNRKGRNLAAVAQANKTARIIWALLYRETEYISPA